MSAQGGDAFSSWKGDDLFYFILCGIWPILLGGSVSIAFALWSLGVIILFGSIFLITDFILSGGIIIALLSAITLLVWSPVFCVLCGSFYGFMLGDFPKRIPRNKLVYIWWAGVGSVVAAVLGWRLTQNQTPTGIPDLIWVVALLLFGSYFVTSRSFPLVNTVKEDDTITITAVVSGYMITGSTLEIVSYILNAPIRSEALDSEWSDVGMTIIYSPLILLAEFVDWIFEVLGNELTVGSIITGQGLDPLIELATFNLAAGTGMYRALAISLVGIPAFVVILELAYFGGLTPIISQLQATISSLGGSSTSAHPRTSRTSQLRTVLGQIVDDGINSALTLIIDMMVLGLYLGIVAILTLVSSISLYFVIAGINILAGFRIFGIFPPIVGQALTLGTEFVVLGTSLLIIATTQTAHLDNIDDALVVGGTHWDYPIMLPLLGMLPFWIWSSNSATFWGSIIPTIGSVAVVWLFLYRVSVYLVLTEKSTQKYKLDNIQEQVHDLFVNGRTIGNIILGVGTAWLSLGLLLTLVDIFDPSLFQPTMELVETVPLILNLIIPTWQMYVGIPLVLAGLSFVMYSFRSAIVTAVGHRQAVRSAFATMGNIAIETAGGVKRWIEYTVLLRP